MNEKIIKIKYLKAYRIFSTFQHNHVTSETLIVMQDELSDFIVAYQRKYFEIFVYPGLQRIVIFKTFSTEGILHTHGSFTHRCIGY